MTFTEIQNQVTGLLNLGSSATVVNRVGFEINQRYREVCSGVNITQKAEQTTATATATPGSRFLTFGPTPVSVQKILSVFNAAVNPPFVLGEQTFDYLRNQIPGTDPPQEYAIFSEFSESSTIYVDSTASSAYVLTADVLANVTTLSGVLVPQFPLPFHDLLIVGTLALELEKMEKYKMADRQEARFEKRLGELRLYMTSSNYRDLYQGQSQETMTPLTVPLV